jgi:hypothetical protein
VIDWRRIVWIALVAAVVFNYGGCSRSACNPRVLASCEP